MTRRPWFAAGIAFIAVAIAHLLHTLGGGDVYGYWMESTVGSSVFAILGATILSSRRNNLIGKLFLAAGLTSAIQFLSGQYAVTGLEQDWPMIGMAAVVSRVLQLVTVSSFLLLVLLFPTGSVVSRRWKPVLWTAIVTIVVAALGSALSSSAQQEDFPGIDNPLAVPGTDQVWAAVSGVAGALFFLSFVGGLVGLVVRLKCSSGIERLQVKLFAYGAIVGFCLIIFGGMFLPETVDRAIGPLVWVIGPLMLPLSAGLAIVRYRLYDIDLVINRTLVYGSLTVVLAAFYVGLVFGLQAVLAPFTAESDIAVAGSTLAVAALFRPLRTRVQSFIDHRFYRRKFDAQRTLEEFNTHLRDEVDLQALSSRLESVVQETMQPAHVSLWLRAGTL